MQPQLGVASHSRHCDNACDAPSATELGEKYKCFHRETMAAPCVKLLVDAFTEVLDEVDPGLRESIEICLWEIVDAVLTASWPKVELGLAAQNASLAAQRKAKLDKAKLDMSQKKADEDRQRSQKMQAKYLQEVTRLRDKTDSDRNLAVKLPDLSRWEPLEDLDETTRILIGACVEEQMKGNYVCSTGEVFAEKEARMDQELEEARMASVEAHKGLQDMRAEVARIEADLEEARAHGRAAEAAIATAGNARRPSIAALPGGRVAGKAQADLDAQRKKLCAGLCSQRSSASDGSAVIGEEIPGQHGQSDAGPVSPRLNSQQNAGDSADKDYKELSSHLFQSARTFRSAKSRYLDSARAASEDESGGGLRRRPGLPERGRRGSGAGLIDDDGAVDVVQLKSTELTLEHGPRLSAGRMERQVSDGSDARVAGFNPLKGYAASSGKSGVGWRKSEHSSDASLQEGKDRRVRLGVGRVVDREPSTRGHDADSPMVFFKGLPALTRSLQTTGPIRSGVHVTTDERTLSPTSPTSPASPTRAWDPRRRKGSITLKEIQCADAVIVS